MPKVKFIKDYSYTLKHKPGQPTLAYPAGKEVSVPSHIAEAAIAKGAAKAVSEKAEKRTKKDGEGR